MSGKPVQPVPVPVPVPECHIWVGLWVSTGVPMSFPKYIYNKFYERLGKPLSGAFNIRKEVMMSFFYLFLHFLLFPHFLLFLPFLSFSTFLPFLLFLPFLPFYLFFFFYLFSFFYIFFLF